MKNGSRVFENMLCLLEQHVIALPAGDRLALSSHKPSPKDGRFYCVHIVDKTWYPKYEFPRDGHWEAASFGAYLRGFRDALDAVQKGQLIVRPQEQTVAV